MNFEKVESFKTQMHVNSYTVADYDHLPRYEITDKGKVTQVVYVPTPAYRFDVTPLGWNTPPNVVLHRAGYKRNWTVSDYETGVSIGERGETRADCVDAFLKKMRTIGETQF